MVAGKLMVVAFQLHHRDINVRLSLFITRTLCFLVIIQFKKRIRSLIEIPLTVVSYINNMLTYPLAKARGPANLLILLFFFLFQIATVSHDDSVLPNRKGAVAF